MGNYYTVAAQNTVKTSFVSTILNKVNVKNAVKQLMLLAAFLMSFGVQQSWGQTTVTKTTAGSSSWTCPAGVTSITIECWGGGGAGAGAISGSVYGGGGAGGAYLKVTNFPVTAGTTYNYSVGAGVTGTTGTATAGTAATNGTWFNASSGTSAVVAICGNNGTTSNTASSATGGAAVSSGNVTPSALSGWSSTSFYGGAGVVGSSTGAGGGSSAGTAAGGNTGSGVTGGTAVTGGGAGGAGGANANATAGSAPGGGGGGCYRTSSSRTAGSGGVGKINITYTCASTMAGGTYTIGASGANYTTIGAAIGSMGCGIGGPIVLQLQSNYSSSSETFPLTIPVITGASSSNTITIRPASGVTASISGSSSTGLIVFNGDSYVTIDGSNSGGTDKSLTITNTSTSATTAAILISSLGTGAGASNITVKNCNISTGSNTATTYGISIGSTVGATGADNANITIQNNTITTAYIGIYGGGTAAGTTSSTAGTMKNLTISGNTIGSGTSASYVSTYGMFIANCYNTTISGNTINNIQATSGTLAIGLDLETGFLNSTVTQNTISNVVATSTGGYGGWGMLVATGSATSNVTISDNAIYGVNGASNFSGFTNSSSIGMAIAASNSSLTATTTGGINIWHNSINMYGTYTYTAACLTAAMYITASASALDVRNNIIVNTLKNLSSSYTSTSKSYGIYSLAAKTAFTTIDYNDIFSDATTSGQTSSYFGYIATTDQTSSSLFTTAFGGNTHSAFTTPSFTSNTNLLPTASAVIGKGVYISSVPTDIIGTTRNTSTPDIGAYEIVPTVALSDNGSQIGATPVSSGTTNNLLQNLELTTNKSNTLNSISFSLSGGSDASSYYTSSDIVSSGFNLWYSTSSTFGTAAKIGTAQSSTRTTSASETITFSGLTQALASGAGNYLWITADLASGATTGHLISSTALSTTSFTVASGTKSGSTTAGGVQTISQACNSSLTSVTAGTISALASSVCPNGSTTLSLVGATNATGLTYNWHSSTDNFVSSDNAGVGSTTSLNTGSLSSTMYYKCVVSCVAGSATGITPVVTETVYNTTITITPSTTGSTTASQYCGYTNAPVQLVASAGTTPDSYKWTTNTTGLYTDNPAATAYTTQATATVYAAPAATQTYTVTADYTSKGCGTTTQTQSVTLGNKVTITGVSATATTLCAGNTSTLSTTATVNSLTAIKISEVSQYIASGVGQQASFPSYMSSAATSTNDFVEISNLSTSSVDISGIVLELWSSASATTASGTFTVPASTVMPAHSTTIFSITSAASTTSSPSYFSTGIGTDNASSTSIGYLIRKGSTIVDAVFYNGGTTFAWPAASNVTSSDWSGSIASASGVNGIIRIAATDGNSASDWVVASASNLTTFGTYRSSYTNIASPTLSYAWAPSTNLSSATAASPVFTMPSPAVSSTISLTASETGGCKATYMNGATSTAASVTINNSTTALSAGTITSTISSGGTVCPSTNLTLTANPSGGCGAYSYAWYFNNGTTNVSVGTNSATYTITGVAVANAGSYTVQVTDQASPTPATNTSGAFVVNVYNTAVTITPTVGGVSSAKYCGYNNVPVQMIASASNATSYIWTAITGLYTNNPATTAYTTGTNAATIYAAPASTTTYTVTAAFSSIGCSNTTNSQTVTYGNKVTISAITPSSNPLCAGTTSTLTPTASAVSGGTPFTYAWTPNDGNLSDVTAAAPVFTMPSSSPAASYTYNLTVTETGGCSAAYLAGTTATAASTTVNLNSTALTIGTTTGFTSGNTVCANSTAIILTATPSGGCQPYTYQWYKGVTPVGTSTITNTITTLPANAGTYSVTVTDSKGATATATGIVINITDNTFSLSPSTAQTFCSGSSALNITATANGAGSYTWAWTSSPSGFTASSNAISVTPTATTSYSVTATVAGCTSAAQSVAVTYAPGVASVSASATTPSVCSGGTFGLNGTATGATYYTSSTYTEGFESGVTTTGTTVPSGWTFINAGSGNQWTSTTTSHSGTGAMNYIYNGSNAANAWAITQGVYLVAGQSYAISFYYNTNGGTSFPEKLKVTVGNAATVAGQSTTIWNNGSATTAGGGSGTGGTQITVTTYTKGTATYTAPASGTYYFGWNCYSALDEDYLYVDDISIAYSAPTTSTISSYAWTSSPSGYTSSTQNPTGVALQQSSGSDVSTSYYVTATNNYGCTATSAAAVVNPGGGTPSASIGFTTGSSSVCPGSPVTLHASVSGGCSPFTYAWTLNGTTVGTNSADLIISSAAAANGGTYAVTVTDNFSQVSNTPTQTLTVYNTAVSITASTTGSTINNTYCGYTSAPVQLVATAGITPDSYTWNTNITGLYTNNPAATAYTSGTSAATVYAAPAANQTYTVTATYASIGCTSTATKAVTVGTKINNFTVTPSTSSPAAICPGGTQQLLASISAAASNYILSKTTGNSFVTITSPTVINALTQLTVQSATAGYLTVSPSSFTFPYAGNNITTFNIGTNGYLVLGSTGSTAQPIDLSTLAGLNAIYGYGSAANMNIANGGQFQYGAGPTAGTYVFEVDKMAIANGSAASGTRYASFQIILWGSTTANPGRIDVIYANNGSGSAYYQDFAGIKDANNTILNGYDGSNTASTYISSSNGWITSGTMYTYTSPTANINYTWTDASSLLSSTSISNPTTVALSNPSAPAADSYTFPVAATNSVTGCSVTGTAQVNVQTTTLTVSAPTVDNSTVCKGYFSTLTGTSKFSGGCPPYTAQWLANGVAYGSPISLPLPTTTNTLVVYPTVNTNYALQITDNSGTTVTGSTVTVSMINPQPLSVTAGTSCGSTLPVAISLSATPQTGDNIIWYSAASNGSVLATTNAYSPSVSATTTYYAADNSGGATYTGLGITYTSSVYTLQSTGLNFTANTAFTLNSVTIYPYAASSTAGTVTIQLTNAAGTVLYTTTNVSVTGNNPAVAQVVPLGYNISAGAGYSLTYTSTGITGLIGTAASAFPYTYGGTGVYTITSSANPGVNTAQWDNFYSWSIGTGCTGTPVSVLATVTTPATITIANNSQIAAQSIATNSTNNVISQGKFTVGASNNGSLASIAAVLSASATYANADIASNGIKLWVGTSNVFAAATQYGADITSARTTGAAQTLTFSSTQSLVSGSTYYFWLTADITSGATLGNTIIVNSLTSSSFTFGGSSCNATPTGTVSASGTSTIVNPCSSVVALTFASNSLTACTGATAPTFTGINTNSTSKAGYTYQWYSCDDASGTNPVAVFGATGVNYTPANYTTAGTYYYFNTASCSYGSVSSNSSVITVVVTATPSITVSATPSASICAGASTTLTLNGAAATYGWSPATGLSSTTLASVTATPATTTTYTASASNGSCAATPQTITVTVSALPSAVTATPSAASVCNGSTINLTATGGLTNSTPFTETFETYPSSNFTAGSSIAATTSTLYAQGSKSVNLYVSGTSVTSNNAYTLNSNVNLSTASSATLTFSQICFSEAGYDYEYVEYSTNGGTSWTTFPTSSYAGSGTLVNTLVSFDASSYSDWSSAMTSTTSIPTNTLWKSETINIPVAALTSQFKVRFRMTTDISNNYLGWWLDNIAINTVGNGTYAWTSTPSGFTSSTQNPTGVTPTNGIVYNVSSTNSGGCSVTASTAAITVNPIPAAPTAVNSGTSVCGTPTFTASSNSGAGVPVYAWYTASSGGTAISGASSSSYAPGSFAVGANTMYVTEVGTGNCESTPRKAITITASIPPVHSLTATAVTVCVNSSAALSVSGSTYGNYDTYTWSPATNLYTDAGLTQAYQLGDNVASVYVKPTAAGQIAYTVYASGAQAGTDASCQNSAVVTVTGQAAPSITAQPVAVTGCGTVSKTLSVSATSTGTLNYQWQMSLNGSNGSFTNVTNGTPTGVTYTGGTASTLNIGSINAPFYYQVLVGDGVCSSVTSSSVLVTAGTPTITASAGASSCAAILPTSINLTASASTGASLAWFTASTGGTAIATGSPYASSVSTTTTYYVEPQYNTNSSFNVGYASETSANLGSIAGIYGMYFSSTNAATINSVDVYPSTVGNLVITMVDGSGTTVNTKTFNIVSGDISTTVKKTLALGWTVPAGATGYTINYDATSTINRGTGTYTYPQTSNGFSITGETLDGDNISSSNRFYFFNWNVTSTTTCSGTRAAVTATVVNAPTVSVASVTPICTGSSASLAASSSNTNYTYSWTYGDSTTVLSGANQTVSPTVSRFYKVTATDNTSGQTYSGCSVTSGINVVVGQTPATLSASVSPSIFCSGGSAIQTATGGTTNGMYILDDEFEMVSPAFTTTGTGLTASINSTYYNTGTKSVLLTYTNSLTQGVASTVGYQSSANIDLSKYSAATLTFKHICATEAGADYGYVEYSTDGGTTWTKFPTASYSGSADQTIFSGGNNRFSSASYTAWSSVLTSNTSVPTNSMWKTETFTVPTAAINLNTSTFRIRFRVGSSASTTYYGWLIDDVELTGNTKNTWSWTSTGSFTSALQNPTPTPSASTRYYVQATNSFGCTSNQATDTVTVLAASTQGTPAATSTTICNDGSSSSITLSQTGGTLGTGAYWVWYTSGTYSLASRVDSTYSNDASLVISSPTTTTIYYLRAEGNQAPCNNTSGSSVTVTVNQPSSAATAVNASSTTICRGSSTTLTQTGGILGTGASWKWYSDNTYTTLVGSGTGSTASLSVSPTVTTTYYVRAEGTTSPCTGTVSDNTVSVTVTVNQPSSAATSVTASSTTICNGTAITLSQTGGTLGTGATWEWYSDNAYTNHIGSGDGLSVSPAATTTYYVRAEGTTSPCTVNVGNNARSVLVTVRQPSVAATAVTATSTTICRGSSTSLSQTGGSLGTGASWKWYSNSSFTTLVGTGSGSTATLSVSPTTTTTYYLRAEGTTTPCTATISDNTISVTVTVNQASVAPTSVTASSNSICSGASVTLTQHGGTLGTNATWEWYSDNTYNTYVGTGDGLSVSPSVTTTYYVRAEGGTSPCSAIVSDNTKKVTVTVTTTVTPSVSIATFSTTICASSTVTVTATPTNGGSAPTYNFKVNGTSVQNTTSATYTTTTLPNGGVVTVEMTPNNPCQTASLVSSNSLTFNYSTGGAGVNVWTGNVSTNFSTAGNWCSGSVPTNGSSIVVQTASRYPVLTTSGTYTDISLSTGTTLGLGTGSLTLTGTITGSGLLVGSSTASLTMNSTSDNVLNFRTTGSADTLVGTLILNNSGKVTLGSGLGITTLLSLANTAAELDINGHHLTLKSTSLANSAEFGTVVGSAKVTDHTNASPYTATKVTVERFIPKGLRNYRDLGPSVANAGSVFANWQEGGDGSSNYAYGIFITGKTGTPGYSNYSPKYGFDYTTNGNTAPSLYSCVNGTWKAVDSTVSNPTGGSVFGTKGWNLDPFQGMRALIRGGRNFNMGSNPPAMLTATTIRATGTLVTGDVTFHSIANGGTSTSTISSAYGLTNGGGWSFIANPYACPVSWQSILASNVGNAYLNATYYYLDPSYQTPSGPNAGNQRYVTVQYYNGHTTVVNDPTGSLTDWANYLNIQPGQGFWVYHDATTTPTLVMNESNKVVGYVHTGVFGTNSIANMLNVSIWKDINGVNSNIDGAIATFDNNYSKAYGAEDAKKLVTSNENISITESINDLSIDGLALPTVGDVIALKLENVIANTTYQLQLDATQFAVPGIQAFIKDAYLNTEVPAGTAVSFTPTAAVNTYKDRFSIVFRPGSALSVKFTTVKANQEGKNIRVDWNTANESNMANYEVEKSINGKDFVKVTAQTAKNTDAAAYSWLDQQAQDGKNYYRIKAIENGGKSTYSNVVVVVMGKGKDMITVYPNPVTEKSFTLQMLNVAGGKYNVVLINNLGQEVFNTPITHVEGSSSETITMNKALSGGVYTIVLRSTEGKGVYQTELLAR